MDFERFDARSAADHELEEVTELLGAIDLFDRPDGPHASRLLLAELRNPVAEPEVERRLWLAREAGELVAAAWLHLPRDKEQLIVVQVRIRPDLRRRGMGRRFADALIPELQAIGRSQVLGTVPSNSGFEAWCVAMGMKPASRFVRQRLRLAEIEPGHWDVPDPLGYRMVAWTGAAPEEILASYAVARRAINDQVMGGLDTREPDWTPELVRAMEAEAAESGTEIWAVAAVHEDSGEVAGMTDLYISAAQPELGFQRYTAVVRGHRGHGLGLAMKAAQLRRLAAERPGLREVTTQTGDLEHMAPISRELGFQDLGTSVHLVAELAELASDQLGRPMTPASSPHVC